MAEDIRRRRADRVRQQRFKNILPQYKWYILVGVILVVVVAAALSGVIPRIGNPPRDFAHEHAAFALFVDGQQVDFRNQAYDIQAVSDKVHMHVGEQGGGSIWHLEAKFPTGTDCPAHDPAPCGMPDVPLAAIFAQYGITFSPGYLKLDTKAGHNGSEIRDSGNKTWQVWVSKLPPEGQVRTWQRPPGDQTQYVPRDGDQILVRYGTQEETMLQIERSAIPEPPGSNYVPPAGHTGP